MRQRDSLASGRQQAHVFNCLACVAVLLLIAQCHIVARLALLHLCHGIGAHGGLHRVLNVCYVDAPSRRGFAVHCKVQVGLAHDAEEPQIFNAVHCCHLCLDQFGRLFQLAQIVAVELHGQLAFDATDRLFHVVGDRLRVVPDNSRKLAELFVHCRDQRFFALVKTGPPLLFSLQVDKIFSVEKAGCVSAVIGTARLADHLCDLREGGHHQPCLVGKIDACRGAFAGRQCSAHPDGAFV